MREHEMRIRVFQFLKARLRNTLMPATVGIGLAVGGCTKEGLAQNRDADVAKDAVSDNTPVTLYGGLVPPDANGGAPDLTMPDASSPDALADANPSDAAPADHALASDAISKKDLAAMDVGGIDSGRDLGAVTKYGVPMPDAAADVLPAPVYAAVLPSDAGRDVGIIGVRYGAQTPDAS